jgi:glycosyltransferase involved in cell wall biosynthesis
MTSISIVIPVLNEQGNIARLHQELADVVRNIERVEEYEIIFVDDGSSDNTFDVLKRLYLENDNIRVIRFRRNFGKAAALSAGFAAADGGIIFTMDGDLQDNPAEIENFLDALEQGYDLISGWKYPRHDPPSKTIPSKVWNFMIGRLSGVHLHDFNCGFKAYRREVALEMQLYGDLHRYTPLLAAQKGYRVGEIQIRHRPRQSGKSKYGMRRFARGFFDLLTVFFLGEYRWRPLHLFGWLGAGFFGLGFAFGLYLTALWIIGQRPIGNRPLLTLAVLLMTVGVQFFSLGLLAEMFAIGQIRQNKPYSIQEMLD